MKTVKLFIPLLALVISGAIFSSCKKENKEKDLKQNQLAMTSDLDLMNNELEINGRFTPDDPIGGTAVVKITSGADPEGFTFNADITESEYTDGSTDYKYRGFFEKVYAASKTNANERLIKVDPNGDEIKVDVEDGSLDGTASVDCKKTFICDYGFGGFSMEIYTYTSRGDEREALKISSDRVPKQALVRFDFDDSYKGFGKFKQNLTLHDADFSVFSNGSYYIGFKQDSTDILYMQYKDEKNIEVNPYELEEELIIELE